MKIHEGDQYQLPCNDSDDEKKAATQNKPTPGGQSNVNNDIPDVNDDIVDAYLSDNTILTHAPPDFSVKELMEKKILTRSGRWTNYQKNQNHVPPRWFVNIWFEPTRTIYLPRNRNLLVFT